MRLGWKSLLYYLADLGCALSHMDCHIWIVTPGSRHMWTAGPVAQWSELAAHNRLVGGSSPPGPTTQSCTNGDFPVQCESPRIGGDLCTHFISAICRLDCRDRFEVFVSALENCVSRRRELAL